MRQAREGQGAYASAWSSNPDTLVVTCPSNLACSVHGRVAAALPGTTELAQQLEVPSSSLLTKQH